MPPHSNQENLSGKEPIAWRIEDLRAAILELVGCNRKSPVELLKTLTSTSNLSRNQVQAAIRELVTAGELIYTFEHGRTTIEPSFDRPVRVGERIVLTPPAKTIEPRPGDVVIQVSAGAAFGAGRHPTTRLALRGIEAALDCPAGPVSQPGTTALDIGTGTGVLVIAAVKLGMQNGLGIDFDRCALSEAKENVRLNGLDDCIVISDCPAESLNGSFALVAANLRSPTLMRLAPTIAVRTCSGAAIVMSGIRSEELSEVASAYQQLHFECVWTGEEEEWAGLLLKKIV